MQPTPRKVKAKADADRAHDAELAKNRAPDEHSVAHLMERGQRAGLVELRGGIKDAARHVVDESQSYAKDAAMFAASAAFARSYVAEGGLEQEGLDYLDFIAPDRPRMLPTPPPQLMALSELQEQMDNLDSEPPPEKALRADKRAASPSSARRR